MDGKKAAYHEVRDEEWNIPLGKDGGKILDTVEELLGGSADAIINRYTVNGIAVGVVMFDGLVANTQVSDFLLRPLSRVPAEISAPEELSGYLRESVFLSGEQGTAATYGELFVKTMSGFAAVIIDGCGEALVWGYQGFSVRSVGEPSAEMNLRGSREGFCESINPNTALVRRRLKSPRLLAEAVELGLEGHTQARIFYLKGVADEKLIAEVKRRLGEIKIDVLLDTGYIQPFLESGRPSVFSGVGVTERPDVLCAKLTEGRAAILLDGSPFAVIVPYLFSEHFQSLDDYTHRPYFTAFVRLLKYFAFFATVMLPGAYVAVLSFHPELIPPVLLPMFTASVEYTPLPVFAEAMAAFLAYELVREAGLRLPKPVGHAIGIVGGIVIGDAAVSAGFVGLPLVIVIAVTAVTSFVVPSLYEPVTALRFGFILAGGAAGLTGVFLLWALLIADVCSVDSMGVPSSAPFSPGFPGGMRDTVLRLGWRRLQQPTFSVEGVPGAEEPEQEKRNVPKGNGGEEKNREARG